jgi:hypothetical protein
MKKLPKGFGSFSELETVKGSDLRGRAPLPLSENAYDHGTDEAQGNAYRRNVQTVHPAHVRRQVHGTPPV